MIGWAELAKKNIGIIWASIPIHGLFSILVIFSFRQYLIWASKKILELRL